MDRRKELQLQYAETPIPKGAYRLLNRENGKMLIGASPNLPGMFNRFRFELTMGYHRNKELQQDWNRLGEQAFAFEVLEELKPEPNAAPRTRREENELLAPLEKRWIERLLPNGETGYNKL